MILYQKGHGHSHGLGGGSHSHDDTKQLASKEDGLAKSPSSFVIENEGENVNVRAAFIHVLGDFLQSAGVFVAALVIWFKVCYELRIRPGLDSGCCSTVLKAQ